MEYLKLTDAGYLPPDTDVDKVVRSGDERERMALRSTYFHRRLVRQMLERDDANQALWEPELAASAEVTPLQALEASHRLVEMIAGGRWHVMRDAREAGDSWSKIGDALGMTKQGAQDWYKRKIDDQERFVPDFHDTARSRAALEGDRAESKTAAGAGTITISVRDSDNGPWREIARHDDVHHVLDVIGSSSFLVRAGDYDLEPGTPVRVSALDDAGNVADFFPTTAQ
ncbi:hypothetical protein [Amycolatopsis sp. FDAARGOS 1241]|uniref:hypothetical protein n=1 Tax=Amycolatopsis sp. FDAARGOS 1241 TaxID=2778070 RepID=UPI00194DD3F5|nr:hypothetical protein [Amycolatopsis sp. FDAARGOS 1241]QRP49058.1 hypothetical protein I6J71_15425 [Amycolatopsis sp. FDAARGOS 1241]